MNFFHTQNKYYERNTIKFVYKKMFNVMQQYKNRIEKSIARMELTYRKENTDRPFFQISDVNYSLCGQVDIPKNYYNEEVMFAYQQQKMIHHLENINDDYIPSFFPWYGTGVVQSALGCKTLFQDKLDPATEGGFIKTKEDINSLKMPNPYEDGLMPQVLKCIDYFVNNTDAPISVTDCQSPLNIALTLVGLEDLIYLMYDEPESVHRLMQFCTDVLLMWLKTQKKHLKVEMTHGALPHGLYMPKGGVSMSDDDIVVLNEEMYSEFVIPYLNQILNECGGGSIHFCGSCHHQTNNFSKFKNLVAINNFCMNDFKQIELLRKHSPSGIVMACDFNPINIQKYFNELKEIVTDPRGVVVSTFIAPCMLLDGNSYSSAEKDGEEILNTTLNVYKEWLN